MTIYNTYSIKVGFNSTATITEDISSVLLIQLGPKSDYEDTTITAFHFNTDLYILIVLICVSSVFGVYGIFILQSKKKIGEFKQLEELPENT